MFSYSQKKNENASDEDQNMVPDDIDANYQAILDLRCPTRCERFARVLQMARPGTCNEFFC